MFMERNAPAQRERSGKHPSISLRDVSLSFMVPAPKRRTGFSYLRENLLPVSFRKRKLEALKKVSMDVARGECVGIIGENGSGKSTLLKVVAGIMEPDAGTLRTRGNVSPFLELGVGFQGELTGRENVFIFGSLLGIPKKEMNGLLPGIMAFSGLEDFMHMKVKNYSSGMYARLAFSCAVSVNPDILLIDEVFAVGDEAFRYRCIDRLLDMKRSGITIVIVSHRLGDLKPLCDRLFLLTGGRITASGDPGEVVSRYLNEYVSRSHKVHPPLTDPETDHELHSSFAGGMERGFAGNKCFSDVIPSARNIVTGEDMYFDIQLAGRLEVEEPYLIFQVYREDGILIFGTNTVRDSVTLPALSGQERIRFTLRNIPLLPGDYYANVELWGGKVTRCLDKTPKCGAFSVTGRKKDGVGIARMEHNWSFDTEKREPR